MYLWVSRLLCKLGLHTYYEGPLDISFSRCLICGHERWSVKERLMAQSQNERNKIMETMNKFGVGEMK